MEVSLIIAAGGQSSRFFDGCPPKSSARASASTIRSKLFFELGGKPILASSLAVFTKIKSIKEIILTVPPISIPFFRKWIREQDWKKIKVVAGGTSRGHSVFQGLKASNPRYPWVMVHDGARPFVNPELIHKMFDAVGLGFDGVILARKVVPTLKRVGDSGTIIETIDRSNLWEAETPQLVSRAIFERAYQKNISAFEATDEAQLIESVGGQVTVLESKSWNPKITTIQDLELAQGYLRLKQSDFQRTGMGKDLHRLVPKRKLILGGVRIPHSLGAQGHSDGDALLHAIADGVLGAIGEGDIGEWFSDKNPKFKNIDSSKILAFVLEKAKAKGWSVTHIDTVIHLERPRLGAYKKRIQKKIAALAGLREDQVSIKAKTREGLDAIGRGEAVSADALVTLQRSSL
ncbi:MAG: 2-C-methyl-D-erythritol 4-phosphate cytidylyltransferase [Candidatus Omnitrophica bacterium]|nr:2-C-methyl-D-erythritol 4-phosphate cytidylyltransferase [Candidatus Omnitrophota bacterium]